MKRIDKIYNYIKQRSNEYTKDDLKSRKGIDAIEISEALKILRNNVNKELEELLSKGKIVRFNGNPEKYFGKNRLEEMLGTSINEISLNLEDVFNMMSSKKNNIDNDPFEYLIGAETTLKNQIEKAKESILHLPKSLHTLIIGETGVGKTLFANKMYEYGKYKGKFTDESPFIVLNCADYYNDPQLLLSQLFGHIKRSFAGADKDRVGSLEKADGGILFLDEIHKLPPEGKEMLFYFMDKGKFNRFGETEGDRNANVLIIGSTNESKDSNLIKPFLERIQSNIFIPNFSDRDIDDKLKIIKGLLQNETLKINKPIKITAEAIKALIGITSFGNIAQLKSNIQVLCAKGFLNSINEDGVISINLSMMPSNIKEGLITINARQEENDRLTKLLPTEVLVYPNKNYVSLENDEKQLNLYKIISDEVIILKNEGMDSDEIKKFITADINVHVKCLYDKFKNDKYSKYNLYKIVDAKIIRFSEEIKKYAEKKLDREYNDRILYALSLHLAVLFNRINNIDYEETHENVLDMTLKAPKEYEIAKYVCKEVEKRFGVRMPEEEVLYITLILTSVEEKNKKGKIGILVMANGNSTASSMVEVALNLFDCNNIEAIDIPFDVKPREIINIAKEKVEKVDNGRGVILLVDMGSLVKFGKILSEETGVKIKSLGMVSTPTVLEAVRQSEANEMNVDRLYDYLKSFKGYYSYGDEKN